MFSSIHHFEISTEYQIKKIKENKEYIGFKLCN